MRVMSFPGRGKRSNNIYINILFDALTPIGVEAFPWRKAFTNATADIFHVHWPETIIDIRQRPHQRARGDLIIWNFFRTIRRVKSSGGKLVWTAHDLHPHSNLIAADPVFHALRKRFLAQVDGILSLTTNGVEQIRAAYPELSNRPCFVTRHPHYRHHLSVATFNDAARRRWVPGEPKIIFGFLGAMRLNKEPQALAAAFRSCPDPEFGLCMAGSAAPELKARLLSIAQGDKRINFRFGQLSEADMLDAHGAIDILAFPARNYFNSATLLTALSHNVPVIAERSPSTMELQSLVGREWVFLFEGALTCETLREAAHALVSRRTGAICNLEPFEPAACAEDTAAAYRAILGGEATQVRDRRS